MSCGYYDITVVTITGMKRERSTTVFEGDRTRNRRYNLFYKRRIYYRPLFYVKIRMPWE